MWLGVQYLSEITLIDGMVVRKQVWLQRMNEWYRSTRQSQRKRMPNKRSWELFEQAIKSVCTQHFCLKTPLGKWFRDHSECGIWKYYLGNGNIYEDKGTQWGVYCRRNLTLQRTGTIGFDQFDYKTAIPAPVVQLSSGLRVDMIQIDKVDDQPQAPSTFDAMLTDQPEWVRHLLENWEFIGTVDMNTIFSEHDAAKSLLLVSDGSVKYHNISYGWVISNPKSGKVIA